MKYLLPFFIGSMLLLSACSTSKEIETASLNQMPCRNETQLNDQKEFIGETAENLNVYQQGELVFATMDVRTYCNGKITFDVERKDQQLFLKLRNSSGMTDDCVCIANVTTSFKNIEPGDYTVLVTNETGNQLLQQTTATIK